MSYFLHTSRLGFRHWTEADLPLVVALWGDPDVMRHMGGPMDDAAAAARLRLEISRQRAFGVQYWPIFLSSTGEHVGCSGLRPFHEEPEVLEVGVHIRPQFWGGRYGEEAVRAVIGYAFGTLSTRALVAGHGPENDASKALLGRLGFQFSHREPWGAHDIPHPYYRLTRPALT